MCSFTYEIGEIVYLRTALTDMELLHVTPCSLIIVGRVEETCTGGTQRYYELMNRGTPIKVAEENIVGLSDAASIIREYQDKLVATTHKTRVRARNVSDDEDSPKDD